jgi:hypothetical protein
MMEVWRDGARGQSNKAVDGTPFHSLARGAGCWFETLSKSSWLPSS